jgi:hypothetical protein
MPDKVGVVISQSIVAFSGQRIAVRKIVFVVLWASNSG